MQEAGLNLNNAAGLLGVADSDEPIVVAGKPAESLLLKRIVDPDDGDLMPLDGQPLSKKEIATIQRWIAEGAEIPEDQSTGTHWAYLSPTRPNAPDVEVEVAAHNAIDRFVDARLAREGQSRSRRADAAVLARRVSLALTGLPATIEQIESLESDFTQRVYARLVDQLLGSPAFGQHWARHWLDLARYADSNGFQADQLRDSWAYRDWVVDALNNNMPFDQFVIRQIAGDLLPGATDADRIATGFHRTPTCNVEAGVDPESNRVQQVFDRVNTTATVFLGTTLECAQCHDHKYDPFTQEDYYRLFAYFNNTPLEVENTSGVTFDFVGPKMEIRHSDQQQARLESLRADLRRLNRKLSALDSDDEFASWREQTTLALQEGRAEWVCPKPHFTTEGDEIAEVLADHSVLVGGDSPKNSIYQFEFPDLASHVSGHLLGIRIDAMRHDDLPGGGPGRGDQERTNFVLHELTLSVKTGDQSRLVALGGAKASFSQSRYGVEQAVDGDPKTGWAIAPKFKQAHWATFQTREPVVLLSNQELVVRLDQHFGTGRVIGRPKISFLFGNPETAGITDEIAALLTKEKPLTRRETKKLRTFFRDQNPAAVEIRRQQKSLEASIKKIEPPTTLVMVEKETPRETFMMKRGDYLSPGDRVSAGTPESLHPVDPNLPPNRLTLAKWLVDPANPLIARVTVNRFWAELFGRGLVSTPEDFGTQSEYPSHPELLDWLAVEFQQSGWSIKQIMKTIVMSATFQQQSGVSEALQSADPDNILLARGPRFRLSAEAIRDNALHVSGLLSLRAGGEPIMPYQPGGIWRAVGRNQPTWNAAEDEARFRRGLYVVWKRGAPYPSFVTFDAPDRSACTVQRPKTNTPLQALVLLNDRVYAETAVGLAQRMMIEAGSEDPRDIARTAYRLVTGRRASEKTSNLLVTLYREEKQQISQSPALIEQRLGVLPQSFRNPDLSPLEIASWYAIASALLNLDQTITLN